MNEISSDAVMAGHHRLDYFTDSVSLDTDIVIVSNPYHDWAIIFIMNTQPSLFQLVHNEHKGKIVILSWLGGQLCTFNLLTHY